MLRSTNSMQFWDNQTGNEHRRSCSTLPSGLMPVFFAPYVHLRGTPPRSHSTFAGHVHTSAQIVTGRQQRRGHGGLTNSFQIKRWISASRVADEPINLPLQAIDVLSQALTLLKLRPENRETEGEVKSFGANFLCGSCIGSLSLMVMDFWRLVFVILRLDSPHS